MTTISALYRTLTPQPQPEDIESLVEQKSALASLRETLLSRGDIRQPPTLVRRALEWIDEKEQTLQFQIRMLRVIRHLRE